MADCSLLDELNTALDGLIPKEPIELYGQWSSSLRRVYQSGDQAGTGEGPFATVVDARWRGTLASTVPIAGIAFLVTANELFWAKSAPPALIQPIEMSLHAYENRVPDRATFVGVLGNALLPGVAVSCGADLPASCTLPPERLTTGRVTPVGRVGETLFAALLIQRPFVGVGRKRLWHMREQIAASLPPHLRELLTRRRTGTVAL